MLKVINEQIKEFSGEHSNLIKRSIDRIETITHDLAPEDTCDEAIEPKTAPTNIKILIEELIQEKKVEYKHLPNIEVKSHFCKDSHLLFTQANHSDLARTLSNIVNNGIEALQGKGLVNISVENENNTVQIIIEDNGIGISAENLARVGQQGFTVGKEQISGSGSG